MFWRIGYGRFRNIFTGVMVSLAAPLICPLLLTFRLYLELDLVWGGTA